MTDYKPYPNTMVKNWQPSQPDTDTGNGTLQGSILFRPSSLHAFLYVQAQVYPIKLQFLVEYTPVLQVDVAALIAWKFQ